MPGSSGSSRSRGWNLDEFARQSGLHRLTVHGIFRSTSRRLHNATVAACAVALGLSVYDLREAPLEELLKQCTPHAPREDLHLAERDEHLSERALQPEGDAQRRAYEEATQPELLAWLEHNRERADRLAPAEWDELLSLQGTGGPLTAQGVAHFVAIIERKRRLLDKVQSIAGTEVSGSAGTVRRTAAREDSALSRPAVRSGAAKP